MMGTQDGACMIPKSERHGKNHEPMKTCRWSWVSKGEGPRKMILQVEFEAHGAPPREVGLGLRKLSLWG